MNFKHLFLAATCGLLSFTACDDDDFEDIFDDVINKDVPENVLKSFKEAYGDIKDVHWNKKDIYFVARFNGSNITKANTYTTSAWYTNDGKHCQVDQDIHFDQLPETVKIGFDLYMNKFYPDWKVDDCEVVSRYGMGLIYVIEIEKGKLERELSFSENGDLLKDVLDDDDDDDIFPIIIPEGLDEVLAKLFPLIDDLSILEIEFDDDEIEVDILAGMRHKEVKFTPNLGWVSTEYDITMDEAMAMMDPVVMKGLIDLAASAGIDITNPEIQKHIEIEVTEHVTKGIYFEVEIEIGGKELEIKIDKDGKITIED